MGLNAKIFLSFLVMVGIAVALGVLGWTTSARTVGSLDAMTNADLPAVEKLGVVSRNMDALLAAQRTLLNGNLSMAQRELQNRAFDAARAEINAASGEIDGLFGRPAGKPAGRERVRALWEEAKAKIAAWRDGNNELRRLYADWEKTTILNPDALLGNLQRYRGDHYNLAMRLGEMGVRGKPLGAEISSADNLCAFGKWRVAFDEGKELFSKNPEFVRAMGAMTEPHREFHQTAHTVQRLLQEDPEKNRAAILDAYQRNLAAAARVVGNFEAMVQEAQKAKDIYAKAESLTFGPLREAQQNAVDAMNGLLEANHKDIGESSAETIGRSRGNVALVRCMVAGALVLGVALALFLRWTIRTSLTGPLLRTISSLSGQADSLGQAAEQFAGTSSALSDGANDQAASLEETSSTLEQMASMTRRNADNAKGANELMGENARQISESSAAVRRMTAAMGEISDSSEKIGRIIKTIEEIAFQTNLLALNAAVEAARAGEAGKGFAVVADEVRNLAQRSAQASRDTAALIEGTVHRIANGASITRDIESHFASLTGIAARFEKMVSEISVATNEQAQGMDQINTAIARIDKITQQTSVNAEESAAACNGLNDDVAGIRVSVDDLGKVLGRSRASGVAYGGGDAGYGSGVRPALPPPSDGF